MWFNGVMFNVHTVHKMCNDLNELYGDQLLSFYCCVSVYSSKIHYNRTVLLHLGVKVHYVCVSECNIQEEVCYHHCA